MKYISALLAVILLTPSLWAASKKMTLTLLDDSNVSCTILQFAPPSDDIAVRTSEGTQHLSFRALTEDSQHNLEHWYADKKFKSSSSLKIAIEEQTQEQMKSEGHFKFENRHTTYTITFNNKSNISMKDIHVDYEIFFEQEIAGSTLDAQLFRLAGSKHFDVIDAKDTVSFKTEKVTITDTSLSDTDNLYFEYKSGAKRHSEGKLLGMHVMLTKESFSGDELKREGKNGRLPSKSKWKNYQKVYPEKATGKKKKRKK